MNLERMVEVRDAVHALCALVDAGQFEPTNAQMYAVAVVVQCEAGPLAHDLLCQLAARCQAGRAALKASAS